MDHSHQLLLPTGATGLIGFRILLDALDPRYTVRAVVRSTERKKELLQHARLEKSFIDHRLSFVEVPDFESLQAYGAALNGVTFIIHAASPLRLPIQDPVTDILDPMTLGNSALLQAATQTPTLQRIIFTSTVLTTMPLSP